MDSATIFTPPSTGLSGILLSVQTRYISEGPEYEKNINTISMHGEEFYQLHTETTTAVKKRWCEQNQYFRGFVVLIFHLSAAF